MELPNTWNKWMKVFWYLCIKQSKKEEPSARTFFCKVWKEVCLFVKYMSVHVLNIGIGKVIGKMSG